MPRSLLGSLCGLAVTAALAAVLVPLRHHVSIATVGLILVVPVVAGVVTGGVPAGVVSVAAGFLTYDLVFIPPYYTLSVGAAQNWVALIVYVIVMLLVAQVVSRLQIARAVAQRRAGDAWRLLELSELLVTDRTQEDLLQSIVDAVRQVFGFAGVALLLPGDSSRLEPAATSGEGPSPTELSGLYTDARVPVAIGPTGAEQPDGLQAVALAAAGRPVGILALRGPAEPGLDRALLRTFVNQAALAIERGQLRNQALRSQVLEESDRMRQALLGAVSHDLRTPLATIKVASTTLLESSAGLDDAARRELYGLLDTQTDRLDRLVAGLLDMNRHQAGALELHLANCSLGDLIGDAVAALRPSIGDREVTVTLPDDSTPDASTVVHVDPLLIAQVLVNLLDNADRHAPPGTAITVSAITDDAHRITVCVTDGGPGVPAGEHEAVFDSFSRSDAGGRAGLGLWICRSFVEAHGHHIWVEDVAPQGARFAFTLDRA